MFFQHFSITKHTPDNRIPSSDHYTARESTRYTLLDYSTCYMDMIALTSSRLSEEITNKVYCRGDNMTYNKSSLTNHDICQSYEE